MARNWKELYDEATKSRLMGVEAVFNVTEYYRGSFLDGLKAAHQIADALNGGDASSFSLGFTHGLNCTHRYLQSEVFTAMLQALVATREFHTDGRNEFTVKLAGQIGDWLDTVNYGTFTRVSTKYQELLNSKKAYA